jgi:RNA polymerase sigma-70 factor, ECF subfamily
MDGSLAAPGLLPNAHEAVGAREGTHLTALFSALYREHFAYVWRALARLGIRDADLPDLAHDVFVVVHRKLGGYDATRPAKPWLFGICFRVALDKKRKHATFKEVLGTDAPEREQSAFPSPEAAASARQAHDLVMRALEVLDFDKRAVFVLCDLEGMSVPEVAQVIDAPVNTLYSRLRLARAAFTEEVRRLQQLGAHVGARHG